MSDVHRLAATLGDLPADVSLDVSDDPLLASYHLVAAVAARAGRPLPDAVGTHTACVLTWLDEALADVEAMLRFRAT